MSGAPLETGAPGRRIAAVLLDLDGTLIDSAPDLAASVNLLAARHGHPALGLDAVKDMIGDGVRKLVERAYAALGQPLSDAELDAEFDAMMAIYGENLTRRTTLMPGAAEAVPAMRRAGLKLAVVTNKPQAASVAILDHFGLAGEIQAVVGGDGGVAKKPAPDMLLLALERLGVAPGDALMVGDGSADVASARAAGIAAVLVRGGYSKTPVEELGADGIIATLADLPGLLEGQRFSTSAHSG